MAFYNNCGSEPANGASFCFDCGADVSRGNATPQKNLVYEGNTYKCPSCGENLHEIRDRGNSTAIAEFLRQLQEIDKSANASKKRQKTNSNGLTAIEEQKVSLINSFPIPNTKEDLLDFLVLAASNINEKRYGFDGLSRGLEAVSDAWEAKFDQTYQKARILFGESAEFQKVEMLHAEKQSGIAQAKKKRSRLIALFVCGFVLFWAVLFVVIFSSQA